jgi:undecaprenyl diphosphate synthase
MTRNSEMGTAVSRLHAAIIMDGNGRWAASRGLPRSAGHRAGASAIRRVVEAASQMAIKTLTLYAFSKNNWHRPAGEVAALMHLFEDYFRTEKLWWRQHDVRMSVIGRRTRIPSSLRAEIEAAEDFTHEGAGLHLRLAVDYSGQDAIFEAAQRLESRPSATREDFSRLLAEVVYAVPEDQNVDLLIRTGKEQRLSDFLLWEAAYAELFFSPCYWPDFGPAQLREAVEEFRRRERRFGRLVRSDNQEITPSEAVPVLAGTYKG